jgi:hypothetical protein
MRERNTAELITVSDHFQIRSTELSWGSTLYKVGRQYDLGNVT